MRQHFCSLVLGAILLTYATVAQSAWQPPIGIPAPDFGINEVAPAQPSGWPATEVPGFYYVDNTDINATDIDNPYGTPDEPRQTIPTTSYDPGSYVEVHGGPYSDSYPLNFNCTVSQPCWFRGASQANMPIFDGRIDIFNTEYLIFENIDINGGEGGPVGINSTNGENSHHVAIRHSNIRNRSFSGSSSGIGVIPWYNSNISDIVIYNNEINTLGDYQATEDTDFHGVTPSLWGRDPSSTLSRVWVLDNHCYHVSGNCVQVNAGNWPDSHDYLTHVYIGRNVSHDGRQGAFGIKQSSHVIISQNTMYSADMVGAQSGDGVGTQYGPDNLWILFNNVYDTPYGVRQTDTQPGVEDHNTYIIGNLFHDLRDVPDAARAWGSSPGWGISLWHGVLSRHIVNNTFYNTRGGVLSIFDGPVHIYNNIFNSTRLNNDNTAHITITHAGRTGLSSQDGNTFDISASFEWWNSERPADDLQRGVSYSLADYITNYPTQCTTCTENIDPLFVDPANANFRLQSTSPIIDNSSENYVYQRFFDLYGIDIRVDYDGNARPNGSGWEAGAFEYYDASALAITTSSLHDAQQGVEYTATLRGYGGRTPYTWSMQNGALPTGLTLAADGTISGTPTENGNFTIDVQITDLDSVSNTKTLSITVSAPALSITTSSLHDAQQGVEYTATLRGYGGRTPYTWSMQNGALPTGLTLAADGTISGTPTENGNFTIDVQITDLNSVSNTKTFSITVVSAAVQGETTSSGGGGVVWLLNIFALLLILGRWVQHSRHNKEV